MQNVSYENEFHLHENGCVGKTNFHKNSFAIRLVLTQRQTRTRKWAIAGSFMELNYSEMFQTVFKMLRAIWSTL